MRVISSSAYQLGTAYCCLLCLIAAGIIHITQKKLRTLSSNLYFGMLISTIIYICSDIMSFLVALERIELTPMVCGSIVFVNSTATLVILYLVTNYGYLTGTSRKIRPTKRIAFLTGIPGIISMMIFLILMETGKFYRIEDGEVGITLPTFVVILSAYFLYSIMNVVMTIINNGQLIVPLLALSEGFLIIYEGIANGLLPLGFLMTINILVLFNVVHHPRIYDEDTLNCFNKKAFTEYVNDLELRRKEYFIITVDVVGFSYFHAKFGNQVAAKMLEKLLSMLPENSRETSVFNYEKDIFAIVTTSRKEYESNLDYWTNNLEQIWIIDGNRMKVPFFVTSLYKDNKEFYDGVPAFVARYLDFEKQTHQSRYVYVNDRLDLISREKAVSDAVSSAIAHNGFEIFLQPIINLQTKKFDKAEVLARLKDPELGFIPPYEFIAIAEKNGLITDVTKQVITKTLQFMSEYNIPTLGVNNLNINISSMEVNDDSVLKFIDAMLPKYELKPENLTIELTESTDGESYESLQNISEAFKERGYMLALDDFGTGYSNLDRIMAIPFDSIKVDKTMIDLLTERKEVILNATIKMMKECGYKVVVEGVETKEMAEKMEAQGVDYIQGFYYAKPMPINEYLDFINVNN